MRTRLKNATAVQVGVFPPLCNKERRNVLDGGLLAFWLNISIQIGPKWWWYKQYEIPPYWSQLPVALPRPPNGIRDHSTKHIIIRALLKRGLGVWMLVVSSLYVLFAVSESNVQVGLRYSTLWFHFLMRKLRFPWRMADRLAWWASESTLCVAGVHEDVYIYARGDLSYRNMHATRMRAGMWWVEVCWSGMNGT